MVEAFFSSRKGHYQCYRTGTIHFWVGRAPFRLRVSKSKSSRTSSIWMCMSKVGLKRSRTRQLLSRSGNWRGETASVTNRGESNNIYCKNQLVSHVNDTCALCFSAQIRPMMFWYVYVYKNFKACYVYIFNNFNACDIITLSTTLYFNVSAIEVFNFCLQLLVDELSQSDHRS